MPKYLDKELIRELAELLDETGLTEIEYEAGGRRVRVARGGTAVVTAPVPVPSAAPALANAPGAAADTNHPGAVTAPMVGTIYHTAEPGGPILAKVGEMVEEGQALFIIEAMKTMNPVRAPRAGRVGRVLVANAVPVEFGEVLAILE